MTTIGRVFLERCQNDEHAASRVFVIDDRRHTYADIARHARVIASRIGAPNGVSSKRVGIVLRTDATFVASFLGVLLSGATAVPIDPRLRAREIAFLAQHAELSAILAFERIPEVDCPIISPSRGDLGADEPDARVASMPDDVAVMLPTSGSTASPKVVQLTHRNLLHNARSWNARYGVGAGDTIVTVLAACHSFGLTACLLSALEAHATVVFCQNSLPAGVLADVAKHEASIFVAASSFYAWLVRTAAPTSNDAAFRATRLAMSGACALPPAVAAAFRDRFGLPIHQTYGLTEASPVVTAAIDATNDTVGPALDDVELRVVDDELHVRGPTTMLGYWRNETATREVSTDDGWLRTGDLASIDPATREVRINGRKKDLIIRGGEKIHPEEIEEVLAEHPLVRDVAVVGIAHESTGESPVAFVVLDNTAARNPAQAIESLQAFTRSRLADFKSPRLIRVVTEIPRNPTGKILRRVLRDTFSAENDRAAATGSGGLG